MKRSREKPPDATELRRRAEKRLKASKKQAARPGTKEETRRLLHELQVHQTELEMQNEELQQARAEVVAVLGQYADLYDFAPVGYVTLDRDGTIRQANLTGARLLGVERSRLMNRRFGLFVSEDSRPAFNAFLQKIFEGHATKTCEVALWKEGNQPLWAHIEATVSEGGQECRAAVVDITDRKRAEQEIVLLQSITKAVSEAEDLPSALVATLRLVCQTTGWICGEVWMPRPDGKFLEAAPVWYSSVEGLDTFMRLSKELKFSPGVGLPGRVWVSKTPVWLRDIRQEENFPRKAIIKETGLMTAMGIPIRIGDEVVAIMNFFAFEPRAEDERLIGLVTTVSAQLGLVFSRKLAEDRERKNADRLRALHEIDRAITSTLDLQAILDLLLEKIDLLLPYSATTVRLWNAEKGTLEPVASRNLDLQGWRTAGPRGVGLPRVAFETKQSVMVQNVQTDPRAEAPDFLREQGVVSYLGIPLTVKDQVLGVLGFYTKEEHEFTLEEVEFLNTLAGQAAIAIHNAQLYEHVDSSKRELELTNQYLERSLKQLSGLYSALSPLTPTESAREMMDGIIERLMEATGADAALIRLWDDAYKALVCVSQRGFSDVYLAETRVAPHIGPPEQVFSSGRPVIAPDIAADRRFNARRQLKAGLVSCAMLPLMVHERVVGMIHLASRQLGYFDEEQRDHLMAIARQMGIALENKELFENLKESRDELEKANKVKDEFLSVMSHELRTPLNVVVGYTGMIKDGLLGEVNSQQAEALEKVLRRANDQLALVNNILYATVLESEGVKVESQDFNLEDFLNQLKLGYEAPINKALSLNWEYAFGLPIIKTDSAKLRQILQNLIDNAIKFTEKGSVTISARMLAASPSLPISASAVGDSGTGGHGDAERWVELRVSDTGAGIPKEHLPFIFDKFRQADSSETRLYGGVGMGLYIVKKFTELLGGSIEVESEVGKGSTFTVMIPYEETER